MRRLHVTSIVSLGSALLLASPSFSRAQTTKIPTAVQITLAAREAEQGARVPTTVRVRNHRDEPVTVKSPVAVTITSDSLPQPLRVTIPVGKDSVATHIVFSHPGIVRLTASAPKLTPGYAVIAIKRKSAALEIRTPFNVAARLVPALIAAEQEPALQSARPGQSLRLWLEVLPPRVLPRDRLWSAKVLVGAVNERNEPVDVPTDIPVQLAARVGEVKPDRLTIKKNSATVLEEVRVTSNTPGTDTIFASSVLLGGDAVEKAVEYERPRPAKLFLSATPAEVITTGRHTVQISVMLLDDNDRVVVNPDHDLPVVLRTSRGTLTKDGTATRIVTIPRGQPNSEDVELISAQAGVARVTAEAENLSAHTGDVRFLLPWLLVGLASCGGVTGALLRTTRGRRLTQLGRCLLLGAVLGTVFFALVLSGVPGMIPAIPAAVLDTLALNELGATILGLFGGYLGHRYLDRLLLQGVRVRPSAAAT